MTDEGYRLKAGDVVEIAGEHLGDERRYGEILEVLGGPGHEHFRIRWADDHESVFYPSDVARLRLRHDGHHG
ncbi:MAG: DUF1918 domain-containing protein [Actinomycetes bacterium]